MNIDLRTEFPITKHFVYLDNSFIGACPKSTSDIIVQLADYKRKKNAGIKQDPELWKGRIEENKKLFAGLIGAKASEIACMPNLTTGMNTILNMLPFKRGTKI